jgi:hypothetical protein
MRWIALLAILFAGCTNNQLRRSTLGQARTLNEIQHQQVMQNLASFAANQYALPRHVTLHDGTAQISDNGSIIGQVVTGRFLNIGAQRTIVDQWSMLPVTNDVALRLLKVAYRRAWGSPEDLYSDDLANDLAQEVKKQTYQIDDLRMLEGNSALPPRSNFQDVTEKTKADTVATYRDHQVMEKSEIVINGERQSKTVIRHLWKKADDVPGVEEDEAVKLRNKFQKVASANALTIIYPGERIDERNLALVEMKGFNDDKGDPMSVYRPATPLVIELRRQIYETNKDLEDIHPGWLCKSTNKHDVPHDACYTAWAMDCGAIWYVWVQPAHRKEFEDFTIKILNFSGLIKDPTVSGATGVKFTPSGNVPR